MKHILPSIVFAAFPLVSLAQSISDMQTTLPSKDVGKLTVPSCAGSRTPDEQFESALRNKRDGHEVEMVACLRLAAETGHAAAQELLGTAYGMGKGGLPMTTVFAEYWYCKSFENGNKNAARGLGLLMSGSLYSLERMELLKTAGYKHQVCDYAVLEKLKQNDPSQVFEKAAKALQN